jgi:hypothetical protein
LISQIHAIYIIVIIVDKGRDWEGFNWLIALGFLDVRLIISRPSSGSLDQILSNINRRDKEDNLRVYPGRLEDFGGFIDNTV